MTHKMVVVVRTDLDMGRGKIAAQVAHAAVGAVLSSLSDPALAAWLRDGQPKVVLKVPSAERLSQVAAAAEAAGLPVQVIHDAGRTQVEAGTATCCAIGPAPITAIDRVAGSLSLL